MELTLPHFRQPTIPSSSKVLPMSRYNRSQHVKDSLTKAQSMLSTVQTELADSYVEVEASGISLARLGCVYLAGAREARDRMRASLRSLFRFHPAH